MTANVEQINNNTVTEPIPNKLRVRQVQLSQEIEKRNIYCVRCTKPHISVVKSVFYLLATTACSAVGGVVAAILIGVYFGMHWFVFAFVTCFCLLNILVVICYRKRLNKFFARLRRILRF